MTQARRQIALLQRELAAARHGVAARAVFDALGKLQRGPELSEKPDTAAFRAWAIPPIDSHVIKTVCLTASRRKDPNGTGSKGDADTITCKFLAGGGTPKKAVVRR
jgi:hypothetical protein